MRIHTRGKPNAIKNFKRSYLKATIIIIDGPTLSVLRSILRMFTQWRQTIRDIISYNEIT